MSVPLTYFVDRTNLQAPKGLVISDGLVSAMRNPLYDGGFQGQIIVDARFRDNWAYVPRHKATNILITDNRRNERFSQTGGFNEEMFATEFGLTTAVTTAEDIRTDEFDTASHGVDEFNRLNKNVVMSTAMYIPTEQILDVDVEAKGGLLTGGSSRGGWQLQRESGGSANEIIFDDIDTLADLHVLVAGDYGKFLNITFLRAGGSATSLADFNVAARIIGGTNISILSATNLSSDNQSSGLVRIPINNICNIAFSTIAIYSGNNDNGVDGLGTSHINYDLFESEHTCGSYVTTGNRITFTSENQVAFEIKSGNTWFNTNGTRGNGNRVFFNTGTRTVDTTSFTAIRPVLRNSGLLNADTLGKLTGLSIASIARSSGVTVRQTNKSTLLEPVKQDYTKFIVNLSDPLHQDTQYQLVLASQTFDNPIINVKSSSSSKFRKNGNLLKLTKSELRIILRNSINYRIRTRVKINGIWGAWTTQNFKTRDKDYN